MELFLLEHKKLWRKASTKISVFLCFLYLVGFGCILSFQYYNFGSRSDYTRGGGLFGNNEYTFTLLGMVGFAGIVMLISSTVKSNVLALILSFAVVYVPTLIDPYLTYGLQKALSLIPLVGDGTDIFRTYTFHIFGKYVWSPYLLITVPVLIGIVCIPFAVKRWSRRIKI